MKTKLDQIIDTISKEYQDDIMACARNYVEVNIGETAEKMGHPELKQKYAAVYAVVPLKAPKPGMKVRIDGRTFVNYALFDSGVAVPGYIAQDASLPRRTYIPNDSMICNFT
ncbi:MAG: hypothetical protein QNI89_07115 [Desulfobacterales bacterium]|nr:hypothetical protein [Desulfobacterales bacterium]MDJ0887049.1 hypothetical protein [Desulfobacterales bacterium]